MILVYELLVTEVPSATDIFEIVTTLTVLRSALEQGLVNVKVKLWCWVLCTLPLYDRSTLTFNDTFPVSTLPLSVVRFVTIETILVEASIVTY